MTKQSLVLITFLVALIAAYVVFFTDWFRHGQIQILPQIRPPLRGVKTPVGDTPVYPVTFAFDKKYRFTEIRVVATDDEKTNKFPHAVWHMISDSNSVPLKAVVYGARINGMKPKVPRGQPDSLQPDVSYHLYLEAGDDKGDKLFQTHELVKPAQ